MLSIEGLFVDSATWQAQYAPVNLNLLSAITSQRLRVVASQYKFAKETFKYRQST